MSTEVVTVRLDLDARGAKVGAAELTKALEAAQRELDRGIDRTRRLEAAMQASGQTMEREATSIAKVRRQYESLAASVDPVVAAEQRMQREIRKATLVADDSVKILGRSHDEMAAMLAKVTQRENAYVASVKSATAATEALVAAERQRQVINYQHAQRNLGATAVAPIEGDNRYGSDFERLRAKFNPIYAASREYKSALSEINTALTVGAISEKEHAAAINAAREQMRQQVATIKGRKDATDASTKSLDATARATGLARHEMVNLSRQMQDVVTMAAMGQAPMQIFTSQAAQIYDVFASSNATAGGFFRQIASAITPARVAVGGLAAVVLTGAVAWASYEATQREVARTLTGLGRDAGLTAQSLNAVAEAQAKATSTPLPRARDTVSALAATGRIAPAMLAPIQAIEKDFTATLGIETAEANKLLADSFADPIRGAETLAQRLGGVSLATRRQIEMLVAFGDSQKAQTVLLDAITPRLGRAAELTSFWAREWARVVQHTSSLVVQWSARAQVGAVRYEVQTAYATDTDAWEQVYVGPSPTGEAPIRYLSTGEPVYLRARAFGSTGLTGGWAQTSMVTPKPIVIATSAEAGAINWTAGDAAIQSAIQSAHDRLEEARRELQEIAASVMSLDEARLKGAEVVETRIVSERGRAKAELEKTSLVLADATTAVAQDLTTLKGQIDNPTTGLNAKASNARVDAVEVKADDAGTAVSAVAVRTTALETTVTGPDGNDALSARIATEEATRASADSAFSGRADTLEAKIVLRARTFVQGAAPTAENAGDLWFDSSDGYKQYRWSGSAWVSVQDTAYTTKTQTFAEPVAPTATAVGDIWIKTDSGNRVYRWSGSSWVDITDTRLTSAEADISNLQSTKVDAAGATAAAQTLLNAVFGAGSAGVKWQLGALATPGGYAGLFEIQVSVTGADGSFHPTGLQIASIYDGPNIVSRIEFSAGQVIYRHPTTGEILMGWDAASGAIDMRNMRLYASVWRDQAGANWRGELTGKYIRFRDAGGVERGFFGIRDV